MCYASDSVIPFYIDVTILNGRLTIGYSRDANTKRYLWNFLRNYRIKLLHGMLW